MKPVSALSASESWLLYTRSLMCNLAVLAMDCLTRWRNIVSRHDVIWLSVLMFPQCHNTELSWNVLGYKYNPCSLRGNEPLHLTAILQTCLLHLTSDNLRLMTHCMGAPFIVHVNAEVIQYRGQHRLAYLHMCFRHRSHWGHSHNVMTSRHSISFPLREQGLHL